MPAHHEQKLLPYTPRQMFDLVADVDKYHEFLPWCCGSRVIWRKGNVFNADVDIGYSLLRETFNSNVMLDPYERIDVVYQSGPFSHLRNSWIFHATKSRKGHCAVEFEIDFHFSSQVLNLAIGPVFDAAVKNMVSAFEKRARAIYGS